MGRINSLDILIDGSSRGFFHPGETVRGRVVFSVQGVVKVSKIAMHLKGIAHCAWMEKQGHLRQTYTKTDALINAEQIVLGSKDSKENASQSLQAGRHSYSFQFELPTNLPTNFKSRIGYVKYALKAIIDRPWRAPLKRKLPLTIVDPIDVEKAKQVVDQAEGAWKTVSLSHTHDNKLSLEASLDKVMYRPGEKIVVRSECDNKSSRCMRIVKAKLIKIKEYFSTKTYSESRTVAKVHGPSIAPKRMFTWETSDLMVPRTPASLLFCNVLRLRYVVEVQLVVPLGYNLSVRLPVIIDNVSLQGNYAFPIIHGPQLKRRRFMMAVADHILRPKRSRNYNRLSYAAESTEQLEQGHEELEVDNMEDAVPEGGKRYVNTWPRKGRSSNGIDVGHTADYNGSVGKCNVW